MNYSKITILFLLVFLRFPALAFGSEMENIRASILDNAPKIISKSLISSVNNLEKIRKGIDAKIKKEKIQAEKEIKVLTTKQVKEIRDSTLEPKIKPDFTSKLFKYIQLFFLSGFSYVFHYKILFYLVLFTILYYMIRSIFRLFF